MTSYDKNASAEQAIALLQNNKPEEAQALCNMLVQHNPGNIDAWFVLAGINAQLGNLDKVIEYCRQVITLNHHHIGAWYNMAVAFRNSGKFTDAYTAYQELLRIQPGHTTACAGLAQVCRTLKYHEEAEKYYLDALRYNPGDPVLNNEFGEFLAELGDMQQALIYYKKASALAPDNAAACFNAGVALASLGNTGEAIEKYKKAVSLDPEYAEAMNNLGHLFNETGKLHEAQACFERTISLQPKLSQGYNNLGIVLESMGETEEAERNYRKALDIDGSLIDTANHLGFLLVDKGKFGDALQVFERILATHPDNNTTLAGKATALEKSGDSKSAIAVLQPHIAGGSKDPDMAIIYSVVCRHMGHPGDAVELVEQVLGNPQLTLRARHELHYACGDLYDRLKQYDEAFAHYESANTLSPGTFDLEKHRKFIDRLIQVFSTDRINSLPRASNNSKRPVFIVGMPRSGTSLVEQILASHPGVFGAGELMDISNIIKSLPSRLENKQQYPEIASCLTQSVVDTCASTYLDNTGCYDRSADRITDKLPHNFMNLGFIDILFPDARIIEVCRQPMDNCLSLYFHSFNPMHAYTTDLKLLAQYYVQYKRLMQHWRETVRIPIQTVCYEELISDTETVTRSLIDFCGLPWDRDCLAFHKSGRITTTPSYDQVRRPIYKDAVNRWENYAAHITPLLSLRNI